MRKKFKGKKIFCAKIECEKECHLNTFTSQTDI